MVTVPVGTFKALRIRHSHWVWEEYWYSPEVKFWIKYEDRVYLEELVSFHPVPAPLTPPDREEVRR